MDRSLEVRAASFYQGRKYVKAAEIYSQCLEVAKEENDRVNILLNRASCYLKERKFQEALSDCDEILAGDDTNEKALWKKLKVLCHQGQFQDAHLLATDWIDKDPENHLAQKELRRLGNVMLIMKDKGVEDDKPPLTREIPLESAVQIFNRFNDETVLTKLKPYPLHPEVFTGPIDVLPGPVREEDHKPHVINKSPSAQIRKDVQQAQVPNEVQVPPTDTSDEMHTAQVPMEARPAPEGKEATPQNSPTSNHTTAIPSLVYKIFDKQDDENECEEQKDTDVDNPIEEKDSTSSWRYRSPPRGLTSEEYSLCDRFQESERCILGERCTHAHSMEELQEWRDRFETRRIQLRKNRDSNEERNSSIELLQEKLVSTDNVESVITSSLDFVKVHCNSPLSVDISSKKTNNTWLFTLTSRVSLQRVLLLDDAFRSHFCISFISKGPKKKQKQQIIDSNCQLWINTSSQDNSVADNVYRIKITFEADIYGTFRQIVVLDYGSFPVLGQQIQVDSAPPEEGSRFTEQLLTSSNRWDINSINFVKYEPMSQRQTKVEEKLKKMYSCPHPEKFNLSKALFEPVSKENYRRRMHELLFIEEMEQFRSISRYNVKVSMDVFNEFTIIPGGLFDTKFAPEGELFALITMENALSEDSVHGRLILQNCQTAWIKGCSSDSPDKVYEALIEEKVKNSIYLRLSSKCVRDLKLASYKKVKVQVQFQLNRLPMCEMHYGVDQLPRVGQVFPDTQNIPSIPWTPNRQWKNFGCKLNTKQKEAVLGITCPLSIKLPPILLCGPYGTGKTHTLAHAALHILKDVETRILICTHSNSAADLYIKDFLHPSVESGHEEARPLRIYYRYRWSQTVPPSVMPYCLVGEKGSGENFRLPTVEDLDKHRVIVTTLGMARYLCELDLKEGYFTHILLDEAAQAMECESLLPLSLAGESTRVVLAGDHMQLSPEVCSAFVRERELHHSLLERLYDYYPTDSLHKILLCEVYRSHEVITQLTSDLFYEEKLVCSGKQPAHSSFYPLTFFTAKGKEIQHASSASFYNMAEICEIVDRVEEIKNSWPSSWGEFNESSIGIVAPYSDQVVRIRSELRKRKLLRVSVERVLNVQGKQFRVVMLSAVRTRLNCSTDSSMENILDYGFLSNVKLVNTAITRAQSLVAIVGDPVSLCALGKCRKVWEYFIRQCSLHSSLHGITWEQLQSQLDGLEIKRTYVLNPNAPEFFPNQLRHGCVPTMYPAVHLTGAPFYQPQFIDLNHPAHQRGRPIPTFWAHGPQAQRLPARVSSPSEAISHPPEAETASRPSTPSRKTGGRHRNQPSGPIPIYPRGGMRHVVPHPYAQIPYGMFVPYDPRLSMYPGPMGFVPMGPIPYPMPHYLPSFPVGPVHGYPRHEEQRLSVSPSSPSRSAGSYNSSPSRPGSSLDLKSYSPASSPNSFQQVELLPNVKHAPAHLTGDESPSLSSASDQSPNRMSPAGRSPQSNKRQDKASPNEKADKGVKESPRVNTIRPSSFTQPVFRQYSEEPQTPTQIHDLMKMIEENTPESPLKVASQNHPLGVKYSPPAQSTSQLASQRGPVPVQHPFTSAHNSGPHGAQGKELRLNINLANKSKKEVEQMLPFPPRQTNNVNSPPSTLALPENRKPTYAGVLRRPPPSPIPQTPVTPSIFPTREQMGNDAMNILRNLNINSPPGSHALYQYFSDVG